MKIGASNFDGNYAKTEFFKIEAGKDNVYRILPPLFTLAETGQWFKYYSTHSVWIDNKPYHFQCIQEKNKDKEIVVECPFCTQYNAANAKLESVKGGLTKDQIQAFTKAHLDPFSSDKKYYMNAMNQANVPGILPVNIKTHEALRGLLKDFWNKQQIDATAPNTGFFLNFKKNQAFKGDRNTSYSVEMFQQAIRTPDGNISAQYVKHVLTPDMINEMATKSKDLSQLYIKIERADIDVLLGAIKAGDQAALKTLCERMFSRSKPASQVTTMNTSIGGTVATAVNPVVMTPNNDIAVQPVFNPAPTPSFNPPPVSTSLPWEATATAVPDPVKTAAPDVMSDDFFSKLMSGV